MNLETCPSCGCMCHAHHGPLIGCEGNGGRCGCNLSEAQALAARATVNAVSEANINEVLGRTQREDREELTRLRTALAASQKTVKVLGEECRLATHAIANFKTRHGPKTYADWAMHVQQRNADPDARRAVEGNT